jgi:multidrug efflux pump subunit AcrA (membrane-fusion protein)
MLGSDNPYSAIIAEVYNPSDLQVRVDVPISEAGKMRVGQPARIFSALLPGITFTGRVTRIVGQADLQRNTLQAKVAIDDPDRRIRPEVLCRVEFWSPSSQSTGSPRSSDGNSLWIPMSALSSDAATQDVWVVDPLTQQVQRRNIELDSPVRDDLKKVATGLRANEMVVINGRDSLTEGARVKVKNNE